MNNLLKTFAVTALTAPALFATSSAVAEETHAEHMSRSGQSASWHRSPLVKKVRQATQRYKDINVAIAEGWVAATPCVSGPNEGAMGVHFVLPERVGDGELDASQPEALIYEPLPGSRFRLVGVEFIVIANDWNTKHPDAQPTLDGHLLNLVGEPNRYRLPAFYELHVWAWERNPNGSFADWNTVVTCEAQPAK